MYKKLLVPVDGSMPSMLGLQEAIKLARSLGAELQLVHVINEVIVTGLETPPGYVDKVVDAMRSEGRAVLDAAARVAREHAIEPQIVLLEAIGGQASSLIVQQAKKWKADLVVMGTHGRRGLRRLALGSDAEFVVRDAPVPVLLVRLASAE